MRCMGSIHSRRKQYDEDRRYPQKWCRFTSSCHIGSFVYVCCRQRLSASSSYPTKHAASKVCRKSSYAQTNVASKVCQKKCCLICAFRKSQNKMVNSKKVIFYLNWSWSILVRPLVHPGPHSWSILVRPLVHTGPTQNFPSVCSWSRAPRRDYNTLKEPGYFLAQLAQGCGPRMAQPKRQI